MFLIQNILRDMVQSCQESNRWVAESRSIRSEVDTTYAIASEFCPCRL